MMKPFMLKAFVNELEDLSWEQKAISVASHNGDTEHVAAAQSHCEATAGGLHIVSAVESRGSFDRLSTACRLRLVVQRLRETGSAST